MTYTRQIEVTPGDRYGWLTAIREVERRGRHRHVLVRCDCGKQIEAALSHLRNGHTASCGCKQRITVTPGDHYGWLTVEMEIEPRGRYRRLLLRCVCGEQAIADLHNLHGGRTKSCGCKQHPVTEEQERFWSKVDKTETCWLWTGAKDQGGYGKFGAYDGKGHRSRMRGAHRVAWEWANGPVPEGLVLDHLCRVRACCRPDHLRVTTHAENILSGTGWSARNVVKTHCPQGHPYDTENTRRYNGRRSCRTCGNANDRRKYAEKRAAREAT